MDKLHNYELTVKWTGNKGKGTDHYFSYERSHTVSVKGKIDILGSSDTAFRGDATKHNPEDFFVASLSTCHMLWYLHLCADAGVIVTAYTDNAKGILQEVKGGGGHFTKVILHPQVTVKEKAMIEKANALHAQAHQFCFIANSCNFPIHHQPSCQAEIF
jgi:organic hydroperoxide reductase OsmC/OhrA